MKLIELLLEEQTLDLATKVKPLRDLLDAWHPTFDSAVKVLQAGLDSGTIYNTEFNEAKGDLIRIIEKVLGNLSRDLDQEVYRIFYFEDVSYFVNYNSIKKQLALIKKLSERNLDPKSEKIRKSWEVALEAAQEIKNVVDKLKPMVIKGRKPSIPDPNAFRMKMGSDEAQRTVKKEISSTIIDVLDKYEASLKKFFESYIKDLSQQGEYAYEDSHKRDSFRVMIISQCFDFDVESRYKGHGTRYYNLVVNSKGESFPEKEAATLRKNIEERFMNKNVMKLSHIVELKGKGNLRDVTPLDSRAPVVNSSSGVIEAGFHFRFNDGSEFKVVNKVVNKYTYSGNPFAQFPTTFHDVILPDRTKMKSPSEEKMVKEFGAAQDDSK